MDSPEMVESDLSPLAGKPYRPSNGTEGECFYEDWCARCIKDAGFRADPDSGNGCPILAASYAFNLDHSSYPREWVRDDKGCGICTAFDPRTKADLAYLAWKEQRDAPKPTFQAGDAADRSRN